MPQSVGETSKMYLSTAVNQNLSQVEACTLATTQRCLIRQLSYFRWRYKSLAGFHPLALWQTHAMTAARQL